jgi:Kef-type K+ transport system membrane component KefB
MGDDRFEDPLRRVASSPDRRAAIASLRDEELVQALAAASRRGDPLLANVLATAALNRYRKRAALVSATALAGLVGAVLIVLLVTVASLEPSNLPDELTMAGVFAAFALGALAGRLLYPGLRRRFQGGRRA